MNIEKEQRAIEYLKAFEPQDEPYYLCYSGGKDSDCIRILAQLAGVKHDCVHNLTTVDAPETYYYVKDTIGVENIRKPERSMWQLIVDNGMPPTRLARYCCAKLKETGGKGRVKVTGVRWDESANRRNNQGLVTVIGKPKTTQTMAEEHDLNFTSTPKGGVVMNDDNAETRRFVEHCYRTTATMVNPIVDWTHSDVWQFLHHYGCEGNPLYKEGFSRIGCIGCPLGGANTQKKEFARWPKYRKLYVNCFDRMIKRRQEKGLDVVWKSGEDVMAWWLGDDPNQLTIEQYLNGDEE